MSLRKFDGSNFNFWKEQMQDYLKVKGQIDLIKTENPPEGIKPNEWAKLDRVVWANIRMHFVGVSVLHIAIVFNRLSIMEDTLRQLREEGRRQKDILDSAPLQSADERIRLGLGTP